MADFWKVNQTSISGAIRYWDLIETMLAAGWTMPMAGDGTTMAPNQVTHGGGSPNGLGATTAWVRMQDPAGGREFLIQNGPTLSRWTLVYSKGDKFVVGGAASVRPTATDELVTVNNVAAIHPTVNSRHHVWVSDVAPYPFYLVAYPVCGGDYTHLTMVDSLRENSGDTDPIILIRGSGSSLSTIVTISVSDPSNETTIYLSAWGWTTIGVAFSVMFPYAGSTPGTGVFVRADTPQNSQRKDILYGGVVMRRNNLSNPLCKGLTTHFFAAGTLRASGDTYTVNTAGDRIYIQTGAGAFVLPWNGDKPLV